MSFHFAERHLVQIDPERNRYRFYSIAIEDNLFGDQSLVIHWGRIGTRGNIRIAASGDRNDLTRRAMVLERQKCRTGYEANAPRD